MESRGRNDPENTEKLVSEFEGANNRTQHAGTNIENLTLSIESSREMDWLRRGYYSKSVVLFE